MPHLEFTVAGPPVSHQTKDKGSLKSWKAVIRTEATKRWGAGPPLIGKLKCTIINFHEGNRASLDDDNMVKPIRDAMNGLVYGDDSQICYSETMQISIDAPIKIRRASAVLLTAFSKGDEFLYIRIDDAPDFIQLPSDTMDSEALERIANRYRDDGYAVIVLPRADQVPLFAADFRPDLIATRGNEGVVVEVKTNRLALASDPSVTRLAEIIGSQPGWRLDLFVLEHETAVEKAVQDAAEPSEEQFAQILKAADELTEKGYSSHACVVAWGGLEAAMRRLRDEARLSGRSTPNELMRTLYGNGFLTREQFDRLNESYKIRTQVVHGLVPQKVDPESVRYLIATARSLMSGEGVASPAR